MKNKIAIFILTFTVSAILLIVMADAETKETKISKSAYNACVKYGEEYNICPELLMAIIERESNGQANVSNGSCVGLMQISTYWHSDRIQRLGVTNMYDEEQNIHVGADYLHDLFVKYEDPALVLMAYHGESNFMDNWQSGYISDYANGILERSAELEKLHDKKEEEECIFQNSCVG